MRRKKSERDEKTFFQQIFKFMSNHAAAVQNLVAFSGIFVLGVGKSEKRDFPEQTIKP